MSQSTRSSKVKRQIKTKIFKHKKVVRCCFCRRTLSMATATLEHITPLSKGGGWTAKNIALSCENCNHERGTEDYVVFRTRKRSGRREREYGQLHVEQCNQETS